MTEERGGEVPVSSNVPQAPVGPAKPAEIVPKPEEGIGALFKGLLSVLSDGNAGKRVDTLLEIWRDTERSSAASQKWGHIVRGLLSIAALGAVVYLAATRVIAGEAVTAILGGFVGYLWGEKHSKKDGAG